MQCQPFLEERRHTIGKPQRNVSRGERSRLGGSRDDFVGNMSGLPGPLELLPSQYFPRDEEGRPWHPLLRAHADYWAPF